MFLTTQLQGFQILANFLMKANELLSELDLKELVCINGQVQVATE